MFGLTLLNVIDVWFNSFEGDWLMFVLTDHTVDGLVFERPC